MGGQTLNCPLCCNKTFSCKQSLIEHLSNVLENVYCPVCNNKLTSLGHLIEHLNQDNCQPDNTVHTIILEQSAHGDNIKNSTIIENSDIKVFQNEINTGNGNNSFTNENGYQTQVDLNNPNKMYVELLSKQLKNPCLQTRELKLVKEDGESRYMIVSQEDGELNAESSIVTKQNTDGTISMTTIEDMKIETDALIESDALIETENVEDTDGMNKELYSCNTCNVSFTSVIEHIQIYHSDQDVVVEEPIDESMNQPVSFEDETLISEDPLVTSDKQTPRRVITDTGDIVEEPVIIKTYTLIKEDSVATTDAIRHQPLKVESKPGRVISRHSVQSDTVNEENFQANRKEKTGPYHRVIVKEVPTDSGFSVKMYQCLACDISVTDLNEFKISPCKTLKYPCLYCPAAYENSKSLSAHMKVHKLKKDSVVDDAVQPFNKCEVCSTVFATNKSLKLHKRMHEPIKSRPIEPPVENMDGSEVSDGKYICPICNKLIPIDYKTIHQNSHATSNKMNCGVCNKKFTSAEYLEMHMSVHNMDKVPINNQDQSLPYNCAFCTRRFSRPHEKVKHERIHTGEKPHSCEICGKSFRVSYCLTLHMRTHTGARPYECVHCGKRFKAHSVYNHHLLTHSEVRAYKCPYCPKAFKTSVQLAGHKNSHTKPFSCQHCNRPFASLYAVRVHTETHARQNNLKFSCDLCGASYARAFALKDHVKQAHKQEPPPSPSRMDSPEEEWIIKELPEAKRIQMLNKDLQQEITDLGMNATECELIVP